LLKNFSQKLNVKFDLMKRVTSKKLDTRFYFDDLLEFYENAQFG